LLPHNRRIFLQRAPSRLGLSSMASARSYPLVSRSSMFLFADICQLEEFLLDNGIFGLFGKLSIHGRLLPQMVVPLHTYLPRKDLSSLALLVIGHTSLWQCWPSAARALARQDEKRCCSEHARPDGVRRLAGKRGSSQLSKLRKQKGRHSRRAKRNYFIDHRREFWLLD